MLTASEYEQTKQDLAVGHYGYVLKHAKEVREAVVIGIAWLVALVVTVRLLLDW